MPTLTYYSVSADLTTLYAILNGVAMICQQTEFIWGFAFLVCLYRLFSASVAGAFRSASGAQAGVAALANGSASAFIPFVLAFVITNPGLQSTVQIESTINGAVEEVAHVPFAIAAIPAAGSVLSMNLNQLVSTAFGNVDAEYPSISATANGFMNPMKILLSSRTAMYRLGGIDSEVKSVLSTCLGPDAGVNYASIQNLVQNAGNTGATAAQSIEINGVNPTSMGALLFQAAQNTSGMVSDVSLSTTNMLTCADAAQQVANDMTTALNSPEFPRVLQGAVNGMDQPLPTADFSWNTVASQYDAVATANTLGNVFTGGTAQSSAEFMNLIFAEMVGNDLQCLRATTDSLTECQATALQASEVERNNLQEAASEVPMLRYAGSFGNYLIALIIGLGPVIVMFMMFAGLEVGKTLKTAAHIIVWPMLVVNVGAELVNGMIAISYANFLEVLRQGGILSHAETFAAYKELSLQIGTGSHIMASLPVLMSVIFGLGESSAITSVGGSIAPKSNDVAENVAPRPEATRSLFENASIGMGTQYGDGTARLSMTGAVPAAASSVSYGNAAVEASRTLSQADTRSETISEGQQDLRDIRRAVSTGDFSRFTNDSAVGNALVRNYAAETRANNDEHAGQSTNTNKANSNVSKAGVSANLSGGIGSDGPSWAVGGGVSGGTEASAQDLASRGTDVGKNQTLNDSLAFSRALSKTIQEFQNTSHGTQASNDLSKSLDRQQSYQRTISDAKSTSDVAADAVRASDSFVDMAGSVHADEIVWQSKTNAEFAHFQMTQGRQAQDNPAFQKYLRLAEGEAASGATDRVSDPTAQAAVNRHRAAVLLAHDSEASPLDRKQGVEYLAKEGTTMFHAAVGREAPQPMAMKIDAPVNGTGMAGFGPAPAPVPAARAAQGSGVPSAHGSGSPAAGHHQAAPVPSSRPAQGGGPVAAPAASAPAGSSLPDLAPDLVSQVDGGLRKQRADLDHRNQRADDYASFADLNQSGPGTVRRTAALVGNNVADVGRKAGTPSMTGMGDSDKPIPSQTEQPPAPQPKSKFVRR